MVAETEVLSMATVMDETQASVQNVAETALDLTCEGPLETKTPALPGRMSVYIPLLCDGWTIDLGVASDREGCGALAAALMMLDPSDDSLSDEDVADAIGEIANLFAGGLKQRLFDRSGDDIRLGTPLVLNGQIAPLERQELTVLDFQIGSATVELLILLEVKDK